MATRRIVTEEIDGRSRVRSDGPAPQTWCDEIWITSPDNPLGSDPGNEALAVTVAPRHSVFRIAHLPPDAVVRAALAAEPHGEVDPEGFHRTQTVDHVLVLDGPVELVLDEGSVVIEPGDCVIQRGTNHAWRNHGTKPIRLVTFMIGTP
jgi:mannose-6-phosphate isomerase-like protein (cupin superfamily)